MPVTLPKIPGFVPFSAFLRRLLTVLLTFCHPSNLVCRYLLVLSFFLRRSVGIFAVADERRGPTTASSLVFSCLRGLCWFFLPLFQKKLSLFPQSPSLVLLHFDLLLITSVSYPTLLFFI